MRSKEFQKLCNQYRTKIFYTANYHPQANPVERSNRVIKTMLRTYVRQENHRTWDEHLFEIGCALRTSPSETTRHSPYFVLFGREHKLFGDDHEMRVNSSSENLDDYVRRRQDGFIKLYKQIEYRIASTRVRNARRYNLRRRPLDFRVGEKVWRKNKVLSNAANYYSAKLAPEYLGPFFIKRKHGSWSYELEDDQGNSKGVWHVQELKPFYAPSVVETDHSAE